jgi:hypothetical protein
MSTARRLCVSAAALVSALLTLGPTAHADVRGGSDNVAAVSDAPMGRVAVRRGVQGPGGLFTARISLLVDASKDSFGKPTSLAPDLFYSVSDTVQLGLLHTGPMGWQSRPGGSLCLSGTGSGGCSKVYNNVGLDLMYGLLFGDFHLSLHSSLFFSPISEPTGVMWTIGLTGKLHFSDAVALYFDPQVGVTLTHRDQYRDQLFLPAELQFQATAAVSLKVLSGVTGQLSELGDTYQIPLGLGLVGNVSNNLDLGLRFSFDNLLGKVPMGGSRTDTRSIGLLLLFRT